MPAPDRILSQAHEHLAAGRFAQARALLLPHAGRRSGDFEFLGALAECLAHMGEFEQAEFHGARALKIRPDDHGLWLFLAKVAMARADHAATLDRARRVAQIAPADPESWRLLAWVLHAGNRFREARAAAERGLLLAPADADLLLKRANAVRALGRADEAARLFGEGVAACPQSTDLAVASAYATNFVRGLPPGAVRAAHEHAGRLIAGAAGAPMTPAREPASGRRLRVGLISPDLRRHSVAYFVRPLIEHHDRDRVELLVYFTAAAGDDVTARLRAMVGASQWRDCPNLSARDLAARIALDRLDVLVELSGLTGGHALAALALRPAPVLVSHIGYPGTTGHPAIDCRIVDSITDPPPPLGPVEPACTERLIRLDPCFTCYSPPEDAPPVRARGRGPGDPVVFGSFNMLTKLGDDLLALWARVLAAVPAARLLVKCRGLEHAEVRDDLASRMAAATLPMDRVDLRGPVDDPAEHLAAYHDVDIALDPSPYCGTTTTCEALLMGVPVITLAAQPPWHPAVHAARVGASLLAAAGLPDLVAASPDEYVTRAVGLAHDRAALAGLRGSLRDRLLASRLCDGTLFAGLWLDALEAVANCTKPVNVR